MSADAAADPIPYDALADAVGRVATSEWREVTQDRIDRFADATDDHQWIHVDVARAEAEMDGTIAHGFLVLSLLPYLARGLFEVSGVARRINYGVERVRFVNSVRAGARLRVVQTLQAVQPHAVGLQARFGFTVEIEGEAKPACVAETIVLLVPQ